MYNFISVKDIIDNPLAGCLTEVKTGNNYKNLLQSLELRLALFSSLKQSKTIIDAIYYQAGSVEINKIEFLINEVQYEIRFARKGQEDKRIESQLKRHWVSYLFHEFNEDIIYKFIGDLDQKRAERRLL